jgi:antitoxin HigA-1
LHLRIPPANRLDSLFRDRAGQHSIRINDRWRICFTWTEHGPDDVEILKHEFLDEMKISAGKLAKYIHVPRTRIERLCAEETPMTVDTAIRLSRALGTSAEFWLNLQTHYDLLVARADDIDDIEPLMAA